MMPYQRGISSYLYVLSVDEGDGSLLVMAMILGYIYPVSYIRDGKKRRRQ